MAATRRVSWKFAQTDDVVTDDATSTDTTSQEVANDDGAIKSSVVSAVAPIAIVRYVSTLEKPKALRYQLPPNPQQPTTVQQRFDTLVNTMIQEEITRIQAMPDYATTILPELQKAGIGTLAEVSNQNLQNFMAGEDVTTATGPQAKDYKRIYDRFQQFLQHEAQAYNAVMMRQPQQRAAWKIAQMAPGVTPPSAPPVAESPDAQTPGPLSTEMYVSVEQLKNDLLRQGPESDLYNKILQIVGPQNEDNAKGALSDFFQGMPGAIGAIYDMLVENGIASPIDKGLLEELMQQHPQLNPDNNGQNIQQQAGLFLPPPNSGLYTTEEGMQKLASGGIGSTSPQGGYLMYGPEDVRMCPKIRNLVSTFICRYHCLDGIQIEDQVVCGEAIWRGNVMDKYSREYRDEDGNWVGGYINKRFEVDRNTGGHPYQLKPGQRHAPIHEDAWSMEKRLEEMRRSQGDKRGYSETPGDPKDLYNFDQHDLAKGPKSPQLFIKKKDGIAKIAANGQEIKTALNPQKLLEVARAVATHWDQVGKTMKTPDDASAEMDAFLTKNFPEMKEYVGVSFVQGPAPKVAGYFNLSVAKKKKNTKNVSEDKFVRCKEHVKETSPDANEYAVCTDSMGGQPESYHKGGKGHKAHEKRKQKASWSLKEAVNFNSEPEEVNSQRKMCPFCGIANNAAERICHKCKQNISTVMPDSVAEVCSDTGSMFKQDPLMKIRSNPLLNVRVANGVYRAAIGEKRAYADSYEESIAKLAQMMAPAPAAPIAPRKDPLNQELAKHKPQPIEEQGQDLQNMRQQLDQVPAAPQQAAAPAQAPASVPAEVVNNKGVAAVPTPGAVAQPPQAGDPLLEGWEAMPTTADASLVENNIKAGLPHETEQTEFNNLVDNLGGIADSNSRNVKVKAPTPQV